MREAFRRRFSTIRWKLTGAYVLVSMVLALTFFAIFIGGIVLLFNSNLIPQTIAQSARDIAVALRPDFTNPESGPGRMIEQLRQLSVSGQQQPMIEGGASTQTDPRDTAPTSTGEAQPSELLIALTDASGRIITTTEPLAYPANALLADLEPAPAATLIANALNGITDTAQLAAWSEPDRQPIASAPVISSGEVVGVVYMRINSFPPLGIILASIPQALITVIIPWLLISGGIGLLYAWVAGRSFSLRLKRLTEATAAFASGDLLRRVEDRSVDEIGQLSRQFNSMAEQLAENIRALRLLADKNAQLAEHAAELAQIEERNRLARDLHDSVSQELFSLTMLSAAAGRLIDSRPELAAAQLREIQATAQRALQETRSLIFALRPAMLDGRGLGPALRDLVPAAQERQGLQIGLSISGERRLPLDHEQALFRIVQEALANVARHSAVREARVTLTYHDDQVYLTISDRGKGFDPAAPRNARSVGLDSMAERTAALGGKFHIESAPGRGTCVTVMLPVYETIAK
ncbi:MAG: histidine kinase [Chloroflexales bacterium]|nr:histidine kinase [Chloroflexales bacterium]